LSETAKTEPIVEEPLIDGGDWPDAAAEVSLARKGPRLTPLTGGLLALAIAAAGFVVGVLVEKGQTGSSSAGGALPAGLTSSGGGPAGPAAAGSGSGATFGTVATVSGRTLYVKDSQGNTIKVLTTKGSTVTRSADSKVGDIHPGDTVVIQGQKRRSGTVKAQSITASAAGSGGGGLFGGGGPQVSGPGGSSQSGGGAGAVNQLFGQ
jgi:hypothetical protein